jgi:hypothetical protein
MRMKMRDKVVIDSEWAPGGGTYPEFPSDTPSVTEVLLKFIVVFDDNGDYMIHGSSNEAPEEMFKAIAPIWQFDPSKESVRYVTMEAKLPLHGSQRSIILGDVDDSASG